MPPLRGAAPSPPRRPPHPPPSAPPLYPTLTMADLVPVEIGGPVSSPTAAGEDTVGPPPSEDVLLRVPGAQLHLIDRSRSHPLAAGDISLLRIRSGDTSLAAIALLDPVQWPLARDVAAVKLDPCHHSFSLTVPASADDPSPDPLHYGLTLAHPDARLDGLLAAYPAGDDGLVVEAAYGVKLVADGRVADGRVADLEGEAFDLIALPGGMPGSVNLRDCKALEKMVKNHAENGGLYGAICAAPAAPVLPPRCRSRRLGRRRSVSTRAWHSVLCASRILNPTRPPPIRPTESSRLQQQDASEASCAVGGRFPHAHEGLMGEGGLWRAPRIQDMASWTPCCRS